MPDDNRFANIGVEDDPDGERSEGTNADERADDEPSENTADDHDTERDAETTNDDKTDPDAARTGAAESDAAEPDAAEPDAVDTDADEDASDAPVVDPADSGPAFEFDAVQQKAVYPRPESWDARTEALDFEVKRRLRDHGVTDVTGREIDDAVARAIPDVTDLVVENVLEARRRKFDTE